MFLIFSLLCLWRWGTALLQAALLHPVAIHFGEGQFIGFAGKILQVLGWTCSISVRALGWTKLFWVGSYWMKKPEWELHKAAHTWPSSSFVRIPKSIGGKWFCFVCDRRGLPRLPLSAMDHCGSKAGLCAAAKSPLSFHPSWGVSDLWALVMTSLPPFPALPLHNPKRYSLSQITTVSVDKNFQIAALNFWLF